VPVLLKADFEITGFFRAASIAFHSREIGRAVAPLRCPRRRVLRDEATLSACTDN
jgi:hypothetical protein